MKLLKSTLVALTCLSTFATAQASTDLGLLRAKKMSLELQKEKLETIIVESSTHAEAINEELNFIEAYMFNEISLETIIGNNPLVSEASYVTALGTAAKLIDKRVLFVLTKAEAGVLGRLIQKYPKLARASNGLVAVVAVGVASYYTIKSALALSELKSMTTDQINTMYETLLNEMNHHRQRVVTATDKLMEVHYELGFVDADLMKETYGSL